MTDSLKQQIADRVASEASAASEDKQKAPDDKETITPEFIAECLYKNELGDAMLFARLFKGRFIFSKISNQWLNFNGQHWDEDIMCARLPGVEQVAKIYDNAAWPFNDQIKEAKQKEQASLVKELEERQKAYYARSKRLR
ncbi:hypothetical protein HY948_03535, partial [Candidatus Gottesmanbacteria bacterium]|nr:hypothetical protein [Candidatus Gottesmanbacteria bacterium]